MHIENFEKESPAKNFYRTKKYIVEQQLYLDFLPDGSTAMFSNDKYTLRNKREDKKYEKAFWYRKKINGNRITVAIYKRRYE